MFTAKEVANATNGVLMGKDAEISSVSTDTRTIENGALFIAIKGENFDGNEFIAKAFENGAAAAISDVENKQQNVEKPVIYVENSRIAQLKLARYYRDKFGVKVCGVTGSVGKTSTKDMIFAVLNSKFPALKTEGNFNNDIGLPKTLFRLNENYKAAVIEMGMSDLGEISELSRAARPDCAVITNIGWCHIENLKTRENILKAKLEILDGASPDAPLVINGDDEMLKTVKIDRKTLRFGFSPANDVFADNIVCENGEETFTLHYDGKEYSAKVPAIGEHHVLNALAAFCVGVEFKMTPNEIIPAFMKYEASGMRQKIEQKNGYTVILDCYNASPDSMKSSLSVLGRMSGRKIAVLGDMLELGEMSKKLHAGLADNVEKNADMVFLFGNEMKALRDELFRREFPVFYSEKKSELTEILNHNLKIGDNILFKGSRGMKMEEIAQKIE